MACPPVEKWIKIPDVTTTCVKEVADKGLELHNGVSCKDPLTLISIIAGWYLEIDGCTIKFRLYLKVKSSKGDVFTYELIIIQKKEHGKRIYTFVSFFRGKLIVEKGEFWIEILDLTSSWVIKLGEFSVTEYNKKYHDYLVFICVVAAWQLGFPIDPHKKCYELHIKVKDCLGREQVYVAIVVEEKNVKTLVSFQHLPHLVIRPLSHAG